MQTKIGSVSRCHHVIPDSFLPEFSFRISPRPSRTDPNTLDRVSCDSRLLFPCISLIHQVVPLSSSRFKGLLRSYRLPAGVHRFALHRDLHRRDRIRDLRICPRFSRMRHLTCAFISLLPRLTRKQFPTCGFQSIFPVNSFVQFPDHCQFRSMGTFKRWWPHLPGLSSAFWWCISNQGCHIHRYHAFLAPLLPNSFWTKDPPRAFSSLFQSGQPVEFPSTGGRLASRLQLQASSICLCCFSCSSCPFLLRLKLTISCWSSLWSWGSWRIFMSTVWIETCRKILWKFFAITAPENPNF